MSNAIAIEVACGAALSLTNGAPPVRVKLLPIGRIDMRDDRGPYLIADRAHADRIVAATRAWLGNADFMFDYDHQALFAARPGVGGTAIAAGWAKAASIVVEADGIYADVEWTAAAAAKLASREYRYLSPTFLAATGSGDVIQLKNAALVNAGAIDLPAVAAANAFTPTQEVASAMQITPTALAALHTAWAGTFNAAYKGTESLYTQLAMITKSTGRASAYSWMGQLPYIREWLGDRRMQLLIESAMIIENRDFEMTVTVGRNTIEDDDAGTFSPLFQEMGREAARHPDLLIFGLLAGGFTAACYDNQNFFDTDHPGYDATGAPIIVSNMQAGASVPWFLLDTSRPVRPLIYQERRPYQFVSLDKPDDENVFMRKQFIYGCDGRSNAGYGLWQMAFGSKAPLNAANYEAAKTSMSGLRGDSGKLLGVRPNVLVVPPVLEASAKNLLKATLAGGESNIYENDIRLIVADLLAA